ncbi:hypothetical protein NAC44_03205 [Allorhizobium sp. BGMRC 0089]|uniref:hypothetical protein n=1 Tax=Allorhizobium sonneratiae TaxID=2934936 RepID=UPI002033DC71|nr:hypothetical protein [Allorhizobium sonneratiae]MCM2291335.1 hypothetical protein [Allorhizobium sonneratiae]
MAGTSSRSTNPGQPGPVRRRLQVALAVLALAMAAALVSTAVETFRAQGSLDHWLLITTFTAERLLPLIGAGVIFAQVPLQRLPFLLILMLLGGFSGFAHRDVLMQLLSPLPAAPTHFFLVGPIACIIAGVLLVLPPTLRFWPGLLLMPVLGASFALAVDLSDPSLHDRFYLPLAVTAALWVVLTAGVIAGSSAAPWTAIASRVFGSWLVAIGLLYGGAYMVSKYTVLTPPPFEQPPAPTGDTPGFDAVLKSFNRWGWTRPAVTGETR